MRNCPKCKSKNFRKDGIVKVRQRYLCKDCKRHFTVEHYGKPINLKKASLLLHLAGLSFRLIGRFLQVSHVAVYNWVRVHRVVRKLEDFRFAPVTQTMELDEIQAYIGQKKTVDGLGFLLIEMGAESSTIKLVPGKSKPERGLGIKSEVLPK